MIKFKFVLAEQTSIYHPRRGRVMKNEFVIRDNWYLGSVPSDSPDPPLQHGAWFYPSPFLPSPLHTLRDKVFESLFQSDQQCRIESALRFINFFFFFFVREKYRWIKKAKRWNLGNVGLKIGQIFDKFLSYD